MLLFVTPSLDGHQSEWSESGSFEGNGLQIDVGIDSDGHIVSVRSADDGDCMAEAVGPTERWPGDEAVSSVHLPPYYRWQHGQFLSEFTAEWRDGAPSVSGSLRHMESLRHHPRSLVIDAADGSSCAAIVVGTPDPGPERPAVEWRGWYIINVDDPFNGPSHRILATHTQVSRRT